jgi:hypothetical protein
VREYSRKRLNAGAARVNEGAINIKQNQPRHGRGA